MARWDDFKYFRLNNWTTWPGWIRFKKKTGRPKFSWTVPFRKESGKYQNKIRTKTLTSKQSPSIQWYKWDEWGERPQKGDEKKKLPQNVILELARYRPLTHPFYNQLNGEYFTELLSPYRVHHQLKYR